MCHYYSTHCLAKLGIILNRISLSWTQIFSTGALAITGTAYGPITVIYDKGTCSVTEGRPFGSVCKQGKITLPSSTTASATIPPIPVVPVFLASLKHRQNLYVHVHVLLSCTCLSNCLLSYNQQTIINHFQGFIYTCAPPGILLAACYLASLRIANYFATTFCCLPVEQMWASWCVTLERVIYLLVTFSL